MKPIELSFEFFPPKTQEGVDKLRAMLSQSTQKHDTTRGPFLSVNACTAVVQLVHGAVCGQR